MDSSALPLVFNAGIADKGGLESLPKSYIQKPGQHGRDAPLPTKRAVEAKKEGETMDSAGGMNGTYVVLAPFRARVCRKRDN